MVYDEVLFLGSGFLSFLKMTDRLERLREVEDGDYRPLLRMRSAFYIAGLLTVFSDPNFRSQVYEVLSGRRPETVNLGELTTIGEDSILNRLGIEVYT